MLLQRRALLRRLILRLLPFAKFKADFYLLFICLGHNSLVCSLFIDLGIDVGAVEHLLSRVFRVPITDGANERLVVSDEFCFHLASLFRSVLIFSLLLMLFRLGAHRCLRGSTIVVAQSAGALFKTNLGDFKLAATQRAARALLFD